MNDLRSEVWGYLDGLKNWQLDLVRELLHTPTFNEAQLQAAIDMLLTVSGMPVLGARTPAPIAKAQFLGVKNESEKVPSILRLHELENVSAVEKGQSLHFGSKGMTVVFGNNAAGKSSYARVLKQSCRTVDEKVKILPNIYNGNGGVKPQGTAKIDIQHGNDPAETISRLINTPPEPRLRAISIFDSKCGSLYLTTENDVAYVPNDLVILQRLASNQDRIKVVLQEKAAALKAQLPSFAEFVDDTSIKQKLRDLSGQSKKEEFEKLALLSDEETEQLAKLEKELIELAQTDPSKAISQSRMRITESADLVTKIKSTQSAFGEEKLTNLKQILLKLKEAKDAHDLVRGNSFGDELVAGVGSASWKTLWSAAKDYFTQEAYPDSAFPPDGTKDERCPLCHQDIDSATGERLKRFEAFVSDKTETLLKEQERAIAQAKSAFGLVAVDKIELHAVCVHLKDENPMVLSKIQSYCSSIKKRQADLIGLCDQVDQSKAIVALPTDPLNDLQTWVDSLNLDIKEKEQQLQPGRKEKVQKEISELKARQLLDKRLASVVDGIEKHKHIQVIDQCVKALSTTAMSKKVSELMEKSVTTELSKCLEKEMKALSCSDIPVKVGSRGDKGKTKCKIALKSVDQAELAEILSQGEQRGLSLAFFLAEVGSSQHNGPIILDDPVSSLDHLRRKYVAERLVAESRNRQVIVFTHDIVFLLDLQSAAKQTGTDYTAISVRKVGRTSGIANKELPWIAQNCKDRKGYLNKEMQRLEALERSGDDPDRFERDMKLWYELLREAWERAIEERLFGGVVERFRYGIETQRLKNVKVTDDKIKLANEGMSSTSPRCHDESSAVNRGTPTIAEAKADLKKYEDFLTLCPAC